MRAHCLDFVLFFFVFSFFRAVWQWNRSSIRHSITSLGEYTFHSNSTFACMLVRLRDPPPPQRRPMRFVLMEWLYYVNIMLLIHRSVERCSFPPVAAIARSATLFRVPFVSFGSRFACVRVCVVERVAHRHIITTNFTLKFKFRIHEAGLCAMNAYECLKCCLPLSHIFGGIFFFSPIH